MTVIMRLFALFAIVATPIAATSKAPPALATLAAPQKVELPASQGRNIDLSVWEAAKPKGVVIFGHGMGSQPKAYAALIQRMVARGYTVVAPLAVDSMIHPERAKFDLQRGFGARVEDMMVTRGYVYARYPTLKVALAGHSYGTLFSLIGAGAKSPAGVLRGPPVAALLLFSSPGKVPGLVSADSYADVAVPLLMVTGDADLVPGFVSDARDHRFPFDTARPGADMLVTVKGGDHNLIGQPEGKAYAPVTAIALTFVDAYVAGNASARRELAQLKSTPLLTIERR